MSDKLRVLDLFSGLGGFSLGLERTGGFETVAFCEIEDFPRRVLAKHWPEVPQYHDVRELTADILAKDGITVDVITGGFPCQDISVAGKQAGIGEGTRSGLWSEIVRLIGELRPQFVICENVRNLLSGGDSAELPTDRCLCGWPYRWRRVPLGPKKGSVVYGKMRCWDVGQGASCNETHAEAIWGQPHEAKGCDGKVGGGVAMGRFGKELLGNVENCDAISAIEKATSGIALEDGSCAWRDHQGSYFRVEPEGAECPDERGGMVCPSCGRSVANAAIRHVYTPWFNRILGDLAECGYNAEWENIPASALGAPHRRERIWIVAYPPQVQRNGCELHAGKRVERETLEQSGDCRWTGDLANANNTRLERRQKAGNIESIGTRGYQLFERCADSERGIWSAEPAVGRVANGIPDRSHRLAALGNSVVPQIPELIGHAILDAIKSERAAA